MNLNQDIKKTLNIPDALVNIINGSRVEITLFYEQDAARAWEINEKFMQLLALGRFGPNIDYLRVIIDVNTPSAELTGSLYIEPEAKMISEDCSFL